MVYRYLLWPLLFFYSMAWAQVPMSPTPEPEPHIVEAEDFMGKHWQIEVNDIATDATGYTYFATKNGVQRFDGFQLRKLHPDSAAALVRFSRFAKDAKKQLWLFSSQAIARIDGDSIRSYSLPEELIGQEIESFYPDGSGTFHIGLKQAGYCTVDSESGEVQHQIESHTSFHGYGIAILEDGSPFFFSVQDSLHLGEQLGVYSLKEGRPQLLTQTSDTLFSRFASLGTYSDGSLLFSTGGHEVLKLKEGRLLSKNTFRHKVRSLFVDSRDQLWIGTLDHGFFKILNKKLTRGRQFWEYDEAAVVAEDCNGGLWIASAIRSFAYIPHPEILRHSGRNDMPYFEKIYVITQTRNEVVYFGMPRGMYVLGDSVKYTPIPKAEHLEGTPTYDVNPLSVAADTITDKIWLGFAGKVMSWNNRQWKSHALNPELFDNTDVWSLKMLPDSTLLGATTDCIFSLKAGEARPISAIGSQRILAFDVDAEGVVWVGTNQGLFVLEEGQFKRPDFLKEGELEDECYMVKCDRGVLWVHPLMGDLQRIKGNRLEKVVDDFGNPVKLRGYTITSEGNFWGKALMSDRFVLCRIYTEADVPKVQYYEFDNITKGMPVRGAFLATDSSIHWSAPSGVSVVKIEELKKKPSLANVKIRELRVNHEVVGLRSDYSFKHHENYLNLAFDGISYARSPMEFRYQMQGLDTAWLSTRYPQVQYTNLPAGDYTFQVQTRPLSSNGVWSQMDALHIGIAKPYWETLWFKLLIGLVLLLLGAVATYFRSKYVLRRERARSGIALKMLRLELRALKAQINPHFIFNALSSAIFFISNNQKDRARSYLIRFSKLIRLALENSERNEVSLTEEIELIRKYIAIESERFEDNAIEFSVVMEPSDMGEIKIPPAIFQPYVENAIWHGLKSKKGDRKLKLHCSLEDEKLKIIVEDNGIGREAASVLGESSEHQSFGMMIASRRIELLNRKNLQDTLIDDLRDEGNRAIGTRVSIWLPVSV